MVNCGWDRDELGMYFEWALEKLEAPWIDLEWFRDEQEGVFDELWTNLERMQSDLHLNALKQWILSH